MAAAINTIDINTINSFSLISFFHLAFKNYYRSVRFSSVPPSIKPFSFEGESNVGETAQLTCYVIRGDTPLEITWTFQGPDGRAGPLPQPITESRIGKKITMIEIPAVTEYHRGSYSCVAKNRAGAVNQTAVLMVNGMPVEAYKITIYDLMPSRKLRNNASSSLAAL